MIVKLDCHGNASCTSAPKEAADAIAARVFFEDSDGKRTGVVVQEYASTDDPPTNDDTISLAPSAPLASDTRYSLQVVSDAEVVLGFASDRPNDAKRSLAATAASPESLEIPVFTGSAPTVVQVQYTNDGQKPIQSVRIRFSEPVSLATLASGVTLRDDRGRSVNGCVWEAEFSRCVGKDSTAWSELVDFMLNRPLEEAQSLSVDLSPKVLGSSRTAAEAIQALKAARSAQAKAGEAVAETLSWEDCSSEDVRCARLPSL